MRCGSSSTRTAWTAATPVRQEMKWARTLSDVSRGGVYHATVAATRPASDYTARVIPQRSGVAVPLGVRSNPLAALMNAARARVAPVYLGDLRARRSSRGFSFAPGNSGNRRRGQFRPSSAVTRAAFASSCSTIPKTQWPPGAIDLDPARHRTGDVWHVWVAGILPGQLYAYRVDGPYEPAKGHRFNFNRLLLDPFATAISQLPPWDFASARGYDPAAPEQDLMPSTQDNAASMPKCVLFNEPFDWQGDQPLRHPWSKTIIYEAHVRGFTIHPSSGVDHPGTYRGLMEKIPYLKDLGVTAVELMPVQEFNEASCTRTQSANRAAAHELLGIRSRGVLCAQSLLQQRGRLGPAEAGIQGNGPGLPPGRYRSDSGRGVQSYGRGEMSWVRRSAFRGIDNAIFYTLGDDKRHYKDYTGTGNTINANHPVVRDHILGALRYWMVEMHVDGFRFDLASVLGRDGTGKLLANAPLLERIAEDPDPERRQNHRRGMGCRRCVPGGQFLRAALGGVERSLPRRYSPLLARR